MKMLRSTDPNERQSAISVEHLMDELRYRGDPKAVGGMSRFGIQTETALGVSVPQIRALAKKFGIHHGIAQELWKTGIHEARLLASMIDDPGKVSEDQMEKWASNFDSWDIVDGCCGNLFDRTQFAVKKAHEWSKRKQEYVKKGRLCLDGRNSRS